MIRELIKKILSKSILVLSGLILINSTINAKTNTPKITTDSIKSIQSSTTVGVSGNKLYHTPGANITNTLYGKIAALSVSQGSGEPGYDVASLHIRGVGTYNNSDLVIYVDGFQTEMSYFQNLSANEIESISVLKDAASLAPYGVKGANGILLVTTKRGKAGKPVVQLQVRSGQQSAININKPLRSYDYARLYNQAYSNDNGRIWLPFYNDYQLQTYKDGKGIDVDWFGQTLKNTTPYQDADFTISGGDKNAKYLVVGDFVNSQGLYNVKSDDTHSNLEYNSYNLRTNLDLNMFKFIEAKVDLGGRIENRRRPDYSTSGLFTNLERYPSNIYNIRNSDGTWTGTTLYPDNPVGVTNDYGIYEQRDRYLQANLSLKEKLDFIAKGLYLSEAISFNTWTRGSNSKYKRYARYIDGVQQTTDLNTDYSVWDDYGTNQYLMKQYTFGAGYDNSFGLHSISAKSNMLMSSYNIDANLNGNAGINMNYNYANLGGNFLYGYNNTYLLNFAYSLSGSDNYAQGHKWNFYPAVSATWVLSNESFLDNKNVNTLKLIASVGETGNDRFSGDRYLYEQYFTSPGLYNTGTTSISGHYGTVEQNVTNLNISAEKSTKYDIGLDAILFKTLSLNLTGFIDKRSGILTQDNSLSAVFGGAMPYRNIGKVTNKGFELSVSNKSNIGKLNYFITGLFSYTINKIDYMAEVQTIPGMRQTGNSIGSKYGNVSVGFYDISDFNPDGTLKAEFPKPTFGAVQPGDLKYQDLNKDNVIDEKDVNKIGNPYLSTMNFSLNLGAEFHNFDFQMLFQGQAGRDVNLLDAYNQNVSFVDNRNVFPIALNAWAYYPEAGIDTRARATYPRLTLQSNNNNYRTSSFWIKSGDFVRLRNIEFGYTIPEKVLRWAKLQKVRLFVNSTNLFTFSSLLKNYQIDPETMTGYPGLKTNSAGVTLNF
ncbi:MAG: SusC/RagA family TonB-linked outer membrane protein [Paludibacter sp.]|nr:SusC/RagA family TonB-linked outer membrane protein [Paludibacter sp.]